MSSGSNVGHDLGKSWLPMRARASLSWDWILGMEESMRRTIRALISDFSESGMRGFDSPGEAGAHRARRWFLKLTEAAWRICSSTEGSETRRRTARP